MKILDAEVFDLIGGQVFQSPVQVEFMVSISCHPYFEGFISLWEFLGKRKKMDAKEEGEGNTQVKVSFAHGFSGSCELWLKLSLLSIKRNSFFFCLMMFQLRLYPI